MGLALCGVITLSSPRCQAHNELLHKEITKSASRSSSGLSSFLAEILGTANAPFLINPKLLSHPVPLETGRSFSPVEWIVEGS
jgi:hypothetical protein